MISIFGLGNLLSPIRASSASVLKLTDGFFKATIGTAITVLGRVLVIEAGKITLNPRKEAITLFTSDLTFPLFSETAATSGFDGLTVVVDVAMAAG